MTVPNQNLEMYSHKSVVMERPIAQDSAQSGEGIHRQTPVWMRAQHVCGSQPSETRTRNSYLVGWMCDQNHHHKRVFGFSTRGSGVRRPSRDAAVRVLLLRSYYKYDSV